MRTVVIECVDKEYIKDYLDYELTVRIENMIETLYGSIDDFDYNRYDEIEKIVLNEHWYLLNMSTNMVDRLEFDSWSGDISDVEWTWNNEEVQKYIQEKGIPFEYKLIDIKGGR